VGFHARPRPLLQLAFAPPAYNPEKQLTILVNPYTRTPYGVPTSAFFLLQLTSVGNQKNLHPPWLRPRTRHEKLHGTTPLKHKKYSPKQENRGTKLAIIVRYIGVVLLHMNTQIWSFLLHSEPNKFHGKMYFKLTPCILVIQKSSS
jgi:hypothetical protein